MSANEMNMVELKADPVLWARKGNKLVYGNVMELTPDANLNIRFRKGAEFFGIKSDVDTLDIPSMRNGIVDGGGILEPILVSVREDKKRVPLRGNRRTYAGQELCQDPTTPKDLLVALTTRTPMIEIHGLTAEQEKELINDQTQKDFLRSELVRHIFELRKSKWTFDRIALLHWEKMGKFTQSAKKVSEVRALTDPSAKRTKILTWLRGTLDNYLIWGYDLGTFVQKCIMLSCMATDGLLKESDEKPWFNAEKNSQKRIAALKKAKEADGSKFNGQIPQDGSEFKKVLDLFHAEDYGTVTTTPVVPGDKMRSRKDIEAVKDSYQSKAVKEMIKWVLGKATPELTTLDDFAAICETKEMLVSQYLPRLKPEIAAIVRLCYVNPDPTDFQTFLESQCVEEVPQQEVKPAEENAA